jgi:hypothetical protein
LGNQVGNSFGFSRGNFKVFMHLVLGIKISPDKEKAVFDRLQRVVDFVVMDANIRPIAANFSDCTS